MYALEKKGDEFLGTLRYTLDGASAGVHCGRRLLGQAGRIKRISIVLSTLGTSYSMKIFGLFFESTLSGAGLSPIPHTSVLWPIIVPPRVSACHIMTRVTRCCAFLASMLFALLFAL